MPEKIWRKGDRWQILKDDDRPNEMTVVCWKDREVVMKLTLEDVIWGEKGSPFHKEGVKNDR